MKAAVFSLVLLVIGASASLAGLPPAPFQKSTFTGVVNIGAGSPSDQGKVKLTTTASGGFSISGKVAGKSFSTRGSFDENGHVSKTIQIRFFGFVVATIQLELQLAMDGESIDGTVQVNDDTYTFTIYRVFYSKSNPSPVTGYFTGLIPAPGNPLPGGAGYLGINVSSKGAVRVVGRLADNSTISTGGSLFKGDRFLVANILYKKKGAIVGFVDFSSTEAATGTLTWLRLDEATPDVLIPPSFSGNVTVNVERYTKPAPRTVALPGVDTSGNAKVRLEAGNLTAEFVKDVKISTANKVTPLEVGPDKVKLKINAKTGVVTGSIVVELSGMAKKVKLFGMISQTGNRAEGYFIGIDKAGLFRLVPDPEAM